MEHVYQYRDGFQLHDQGSAYENIKSMEPNLMAIVEDRDCDLGFVSDSALSELDEKLLQLTRHHGRMTLTSAVTLTGANRNTLKLHLKQLTQAGRLQLLGRGRNSWYELG